MKLSTLCADRYRGLRRQEIHPGAFHLLIGANASGKSTMLDALRFLSPSTPPEKPVLILVTNGSLERVGR